MSKYQVGDRVLVTNAGRQIANELAIVEEVDASCEEYWCVFDQGCKTERESWRGLSLGEVRLDPGWMREEELQKA